MQKELEPVQQLEQRRDSLSKGIGRINDVYLSDPIRIGKIEVGSSFENTLEIGRTKSAAKKAIAGLNNKLEQVNSELGVYNQARAYIKRERELTEMSELMEEGSLPKNEGTLRVHQQESEKLQKLVETNPLLQRAIQRIKQEEERKRKEEEARPSGVGAIVVGVAAEEPPKVEEERRFNLPDGQVIDNLSPRESVIVAKLLGSSKENPISTSEIARFLYGDEVQINIAKDRLSVLISAVRKKLAAVGWNVDKEFRRVVGTARTREAWHYLAKEEKVEDIDEEKVEEKEELEPGMFRLPDGKLVRLSERAHKFISLIPTDRDSAISSSTAARGAYADEFETGEIDLKKLVDRANAMRHNLNRDKLGQLGWEIRNTEWEGRKRKTGVEAKIYLASLQEEKQPEGPKVISPEPVTEEAGRFVLPDGKVIENINPIECVAIAKMLGATEEKPISSLEIVKFLYGDEIDVKVGLDQLFVILFRTRMKLRMVDWRVVGDRFSVDPDTGRALGWYHLAPAEEALGESEDKKTAKKEEVKKVKEDLELPDGEKLTNLGPKEKDLIEGLLCGSQELPVTIAELAELLYGDTVPKDIAVNRIHSNMVHVRKKLDSVGWKIVNLTPAKERLEGKEALYYLEQKETKDAIEESRTEEKAPTDIELAEARTTQGPEEVIIPVAPPIPPEVPKPPETPSSTPVEVKKLGEEITIIPYTPTEEERRTQEETKILDVIVSSLLSETRMRFEQVQAQLFSGDRTKPLVGGEAIFIYQAQELVENFNSAFRKIREEAAITILKENWSEKEKELWNKLESLRTKFQVTEVRDFLRRVSEEIRRSERQFYSDYPPERGNRVTWIRKDNNR